MGPLAMPFRLHINIKSIIKQPKMRCLNLGECEIYEFGKELAYYKLIDVDTIHYEMEYVKTN